MAQKQIALQQVRSGKKRDLPDALAKGQIGFSTDVGRVFIGLPSSSEPLLLLRVVIGLTHRIAAKKT